MKNVLRTLGVLLFGVVLAGCSSKFDEGRLAAQAPSLSDLKWVTNTKKTFSPPTDPGKYNCVTTEFSVPPQGYRASSSSGGLTYTPFAATTTAREIGTGLKNSFFSTFSSTPKNVELLIVDDFGSFNAPKYGLPSELFSANATSTTLQTLMDTNQLTHGALVMHHTQEVVLGSGLYTKTGTTNNQTALTTNYTVNYSRGSSTLKVAGANTRLLNQSVIAGTTKRLITTSDVVAVIKDYKRSVPSIVINMSFVLTPCEIYEDFVRSSQPTLESYLEKLAGVNGLVTNANGVLDTSAEMNLMLQIIESTNTESDPLKKLIQETASKDIYVAASGNYSLPTAMYPAKWPGVVSVTASKVETQSERATEFFNAGEVMSVGSLFEIKGASKNLYYSGTSYATPTISVFSALDMAGNGRCTDSNQQALKSELALDGGSFSLIDRRLERPLNSFGPSAVEIRCGAN